MTHGISRIVKGLVLGAAVAALAPVLPAQGSVDDQVNGLAELVKAKKDDNAVSLIEKMSSNYEALPDEDKKKVVTGMEKCLNARREDADDKLFTAVVNCFANLGDLGDKATVHCLKSNNVDKRPGVLASALRSLGTHKNPANIKTITDYLVNSQPLVVAGAADALGNYSDQAEKIRKPIAEELVKNYAAFSSAANNAQAANKDKVIAKERLGIVERSFKDSLKALTAQDFADAPAAQKWYNDNKGKKWDTGSKG